MLYSYMESKLVIFVSDISKFSRVYLTNLTKEKSYFESVRKNGKLNKCVNKSNSHKAAR